MSCGHCQLKINAELESNGYKVINIDMGNNSVLIDTDSSETRKLTRLLDGINYLVDDQFPIVDITEHTIWDDQLDDESKYDIFTNYLFNMDIKIIGFNEEDFGIIILCTESQFENAVQYINEM
jgi:methionine synthase II (cobalamin-independent)